MWIKSAAQVPSCCPVPSEAAISSGQRDPRAVDPEQEPLECCGTHPWESQPWDSYGNPSKEDTIGQRGPFPVHPAQEGQWLFKNSEPGNLVPVSSGGKGSNPSVAPYLMKFQRGCQQVRYSYQIGWLKCKRWLHIFWVRASSCPFFFKAMVTLLLSRTEQISHTWFVHGNRSRIFHMHKRGWWVNQGGGDFRAWTR